MRFRSNIKTTIERNKLQLKNASYLTILQVFNMVLPFITIPYLIKTIGFEKYGIIIYSQALLNYVVIIVNYGFDLSATKEISLNQQNTIKLNEIINSVFILKGLIGTIGISTVFIFLYLTNYDSQTIIVTLISTYLIIYEWLLPTWFFQGIENLKPLTIINFVSKTFFTITVFIFIRNESDFLLMPIFNAIGSIITVSYCIIIMINKYNYKFKAPSYFLLKLHLKNSFEIFISRLLIKIYISTNKVIVGTYLGLTEVAVYDVLEKIVTVMKLPQGILSQVIFPKISKELNFQYLKKIMKISLILNTSIFTLTACTGHLILGWFNLESTNNSYNLLLILGFTTPIIGLSNVFGIQTLIPFGFNKQFMKVVFTSIIIYSAFIAILFLTQKINLINLTFVILLTECYVTIAMYYSCRKQGLWKKNMTI
jgi:O-antigen/teichoic acid export membrane protein